VVVEAVVAVKVVVGESLAKAATPLVVILMVRTVVVVVIKMIIL
jgi:hypothetical protein